MGIQQPTLTNVSLESNPTTSKSYSGFKLNTLRSIKGTGFGTKVAYRHFDDISKYALGAINGSIGKMIISISGGLSIANDQPRGNLNVIKKEYYQNNDFPKIYLNLPSPSDKVYFSCWFRYSNNDFDGTVPWVNGDNYAMDVSVSRNNHRYISKQAAPAGIDPWTDYSRTYWGVHSNVWKFGRIGNTLNDPYHANRWHHEYTGTLPTSPSSALYSIENGYTPSAGNSQVGYDPLQLFIPDKWHFYEMWATAGTLNGADATFEVRINNIPAIRFINGNFKTTSKPDGIQSVLTPMCGLDNQWQIGKSKTNMWMSNVYITSDLKRVVVTDNINYDLSTKWEIQEDLPDGWNDDCIYYLPVKGTFNTGDNAVAHVFNSQGTIISSTPITIQ